MQVNYMLLLIYVQYSNGIFPPYQISWTFLNFFIVFQMITFIPLNEQKSKFAIEEYIAHNIRSKKIKIF